MSTSRITAGNGRQQGPRGRGQARYDALLDALDEGFCVIELLFDQAERAVDYRFLETNPSFQRQTGLQNATGKRMRELAPDHEQYWFDIYGRVALTGETVRFEHRAAQLSDRYFDVFAFRVDEPEERHVAVLFSDITERRRVERELEEGLRREREANALLDAISTSSPIGLAFLDTQLRFQRVNTRLADMNGLPAEMHIGKRPQELFPNFEGLAAIVKRWEEVLRTGEPWLGVEMRGETPARPGELRTWSGNFFPVRVEGRIVGLGCVVEEITERKRAEENLAASEARFRRLVELGPIGIAVCEPDGRISLANEALFTMLGYRRDELPSLNWRERTPPEFLPLDLAAIESLRRGNAPMPFEKEYCRRDGTRVSALVVGQFLPGEGEQMIAYAVDITEQKRAERAVRESEAQLRRLIDNMAGFVAMLDREGILLEVGEPVLRVAGLKREDVIGARFWDLGWTHDPDQQRQIRKWVEEAAQGATIRHDVVARSANGARLAVDFMLVPVFDKQHQVTHVIASGIDISARKRMETALRENEAHLNQAASALQDADRRKDEFLATLAHELRNPLAPIRNGVQILRLIAPGDAAMRRTTEMMERQVSHLVRLVDDLLDVSRITRGKIELRREPVVLNQILSGALESCHALFEPNAHELVVEIPVEPVMVEGDRDRLTQVFANLLSNAAKFTPAAGTVWLCMEQRDGHAVVVVRDTGIGIPANRLQSVFEMFSQVHAPRGNDGLGIGLALVRQLVQMHHGSVTAESEGEGKGTRFTVRLPTLASTGEHSPAFAHKLTPVATPVQRRRILVVDDNVDAATSLQRLLEMQGQEVAVSGSGKDAVAMARSYRPELIFMDIGMPEMDGVEAARLIREQPGGELIHIVALTGWGQDIDRERTRAAGFEKHLVKPVSVEALLALLQ